MGRSASASEALFRLARARSVLLSASHIAGEQNLWADALSRRGSSSVEWTLDRRVFSHLTDMFGLPQVDLFASVSNHRLDRFLTRSSVTPEGGPDAFREDWNRWQFVYLFPPPLTSIMLRVLLHLRSYRGRVLLVAPLWVAQPWAHELLSWCPRPLPLEGEVLQGLSMGPFLTSLRLHAWSFCVSP